MNNFLFLRTYSEKIRQCTITIFVEHKKKSRCFCCLLSVLKLIPICHRTHVEISLVCVCVCVCFGSQIKKSLTIQGLQYRIYLTMIFSKLFFSYDTKRCEVPPLYHPELLVLRDTTLIVVVQH